MLLSSNFLNVKRVLLKEAFRPTTGFLYAQLLRSY